MPTLDPTSFDLLTFDCYGTLVNWEAGIIESVNTVCAQHGTAASDATILTAFGDAEHVGDFIYIEPGVPHEVFNESDSEDVVAVVARSDASEWQNIVDYDRETGKVIPKRAASRSG